MRGSIVKRGKKWAIVLYLGKDELNKPIQKWLSGYEGKKEAEADLPKMILKYQKEEDNKKKEKLTIEKYFDKWIQHEKTQVRASTLSTYQWAVNALKSQFGAVQMGKLKTMTIQDYFTEKSLSGEIGKTSLKYQYSVLNMAMRQAVRWRIIDENPCDDVNPPKKDKFKPDVYDGDEIETLLSAIEGSRFEIPIMLAVCCGLRRGEICGLRWCDVNEKERSMVITNALDWRGGELKLGPVKSDDSNRSVPVPEPVMDAMLKEKGNKEPLDYVWSWEDLRPYDPDYLYKNFKKILKEAGLPELRFHDLRHTYATYLIKKGVSLKVVSELLGHASVSFTGDTYTHVLKSMQEEAAAAVSTLFLKERKKKKETDKDQSQN